MVPAKRDLKINGEPIEEVKNKPPFPSYTVYRVRLRGGPMNGMPALAGNTTVVFLGDHRYELNADGDFVYSPQGQN